MEYTINNKYMIIMQQRIQTNIPQIINRIEIGTLKSETNKYLVLDNKKYIKKSLIKKMINLSCITMINELFLIERIEGALV